MKSRLAQVVAAMLLVLHVHAQDDTIKTASGAVTIHPVDHATLILAANKTIYIDPVGGASRFAGLKSPDLILVTDIHGDHFDEKTIDSIKKPGTIVIVPKAVADKMTGDKSRLILLKNGDKTKQLGISVAAIPMYNLPEEPDSRHTKGRGNGYVITIGGKNFYVSGDTEDIPEMRALSNIDVAFVCMNLPYTMDVNQAASAVLQFKPKIVYPYHYRGQNGLSDVESFKKAVNAKDPNIEVRLRNWYPSK